MQPWLLSAPSTECHFYSKDCTYSVCTLPCLPMQLCSPVVFFITLNQPVQFPISPSFFRFSLKFWIHSYRPYLVQIISQEVLDIIYIDSGLLIPRQLSEVIYLILQLLSSTEAGTPKLYTEEKKKKIKSNKQKKKKEWEKGEKERKREKRKKTEASCSLCLISCPVESINLALGGGDPWKWKRPPELLSSVHFFQIWEQAEACTSDQADGSRYPPAADIHHKVTHVALTVSALS